MSRRLRPTGGGGARHPSSLANLRNAPAPPGGNQRARRHGGYATVAVKRMEAKAREVFDALAADAPLREGGELPAADAALVRLAAEVLCRLDDVGANVRDHGLFEPKTGAVRTAVELEGRLRREAADYLDALGMSPRSRARLGLDVARGFDLAQAMAADRRAEQEDRADREDPGDA